MKRNIKFVILGLVLLGFLTYIFISFGPMIWGKIYSGDRITVNLTLFFEGKQIPLEGVEVQCDFENSQCEFNAKNGTYKTEGGKYGKYHFKVLIPKVSVEGIENDITLDLNYINTNSWYISDSRCVINLYENGNAIMGDANVNVKYNNNTTTNHLFDLVSKDNVISITWGE